MKKYKHILSIMIIIFNNIFSLIFASIITNFNYKDLWAIKYTLSHQSLLLCIRICIRIGFFHGTFLGFIFLMPIIFLIISIIFFINKKNIKWFIILNISILLYYLNLFFSFSAIMSV